MLCIIYIIIKVQLKCTLCPISAGHLLTFLYFIYRKFYSLKESISYYFQTADRPRALPRSSAITCKAHSPGTPTLIQ